ncbi:hypothetical protein EDB80DRAFT_658828 [Ilyonectria destructans]|nr:hypothetical protein EDB80DRAFT_658828 [Ilyonectria destructans]
MASMHGRELLFLCCQSDPRRSDDGQLNAEARAHVSRQARLKATRRPRDLKFISYSPETIHSRKGSGPTKEPIEAQDGTASNDQPLAIEPHRGHAAFPPSQRIPPSPAAAGAMDPFDSLAVPEPTRDEQFLLNYTFSRTLPAFGESDLDKHYIARSWISQTMESPVVFYTQILGSSTHYLISSPAADTQNRIIALGLRRKIQAIQALRTKIEQYQPGSSEVDHGLFLAIFILAIHGSFDRSDRPEPHPLSPLATHRDMNVYGRMAFGEEHINALYYLIEQKGGLSCLDQHTFGYVLPLFDIVHSCRTGSPPRFSCPRQLESMLHGGLWKPDPEAIQMLTTLGECFRPGSDGSWPVYLDRKMVKPLQVMADITVALDHYCRGGQGAPASLNVLLNNCDWVAHTILSIAPYTRPAASGDSPDQGSNASITTSLYEICRLCALLYVDMVILPTPPHTGIKLRHSKRMLRLIEDIQQEHPTEDPLVTDFLTWATVLGAISAKFTRLQVPYLNHIETIARNTDWDTIHPRLRRCLWFGPVCDGPASTLWFEARQWTDRVAPKPNLGSDRRAVSRYDKTI